MCVRQSAVNGQRTVSRLGGGSGRAKVNLALRVIYWHITRLTPLTFVHVCVVSESVTSGCKCVQARLSLHMLRVAATIGWCNLFFFFAPRQPFCVSVFTQLCHYSLSFTSFFHSTFSPFFFFLPLLLVWTF